MRAHRAGLAVAGPGKALQMRLGSLIVWSFRLLVLGLIGYSAFAAGSNYFHTSEVIDNAFQEAVRRARPSASAPLPRIDEAFAGDVRAAIVRAARRDGLPIDERKLRLSPTPTSIRVEVKWAYPVVTYDGENVIAVPLSLDRTFSIK